MLLLFRLQSTFTSYIQTKTRGEREAKSPSHPQETKI